jgi:cytoskeletal protein CcmA (bactofilin family)
MFEFSKKGGPEGPGETSTQPPSARHETPPPPERPRATPAPAGRRDAAIIGASIQLDGDLRGQEDLVIEGEVNGTIQLRSSILTVGSQGKVRADVYAKEIHIDGFVEGDLFGSERVLIRKSAQVRGNVTSPHVSLEEGARFKGSIEMDSAVVEKALGHKGGAGAEPPRAKPSAPAAAVAGASRNEQQT